MSKVAIQGAATGTGVFTLASPATNTDRTLTLPDEAGTVLTSASATVLPKGVPAFRAYMGSAQTGITSSSWTKAAFNTITLDTNSNFDTTNYRFQPTIAGYYFFGWTLDMGGVSSNISLTQVYKNGVGYSRGSGMSVAQAEFYGTGTALVYLNGTSDYVELYGYMYIPAGTGIFYSSQVATTFHGNLVRAD